MKVLFGFIGVLLIHALYNLVNYLRYPIIEKYLLSNYSSDAAQRVDGASRKTQIKNYIKYAGVKDKRIPVCQPVGYSHVVKSLVSLFDNITNNHQDVAKTAMDSLLEAKGNYRSRLINTINPFYWLRIIIFIPKYIFSYLGLKEESIIIKIFQLIYWLLAVICTFLISVFPDEIKTFIFSILHIT
jgi:hypothetical protein